MEDWQKYATRQPGKESETQKGPSILQSSSRTLEYKNTESINQSIMQNDGGKRREERRLIERSMV